MEIVVETYLSIGENSRSNIRARPLLGQGISPETKVECSKSIRENYPIGQLFVIPVHWKSTSEMESCLYVSYRSLDLMKPVTREQAKEFLLREYRN